MLKIRYISTFFILFLFLVCPANATAINVSVSEDSYIDKANPNTNYGSADHLSISSGYQRSTFLKFTVPEYTTEAYLHVYTDGEYKAIRQLYDSTQSNFRLVGKYHYI